MTEITCILNVFKRFYTFEEQLNAVLNQSIPPKRVIVWNNNHAINLDKYANDNIIILNSSKNLGVWARFFSQYYLLSGEFVCVFDDDTIPGCNWFKNCIETINTHNALLGTIGVYFNAGKEYSVKCRFGWDGPSNYAKVVDIVGHSWFFKKQWISTLIKELPDIDVNYLTCGEDIHLSYTLQKYLNIPTIVPPHPPTDTSLWGSNKEKSLKYGCDSNSTFVSTGIDKFHNVLNYYIDKGFETIHNKAAELKVYNKCLNYFINRIKNNKHFAIMKCANGEEYVSKNQTLTNCDNWTFTSGSILCKHFNDSLKMMQTNVFYGISAPSDSESTYKYWLDNIPNTHNLTFANIFVNTNWNKWTNFLNSLDYDCVLISQCCPENKTLGGMRIIEYLSIDKYLVDKWDSEYESYFILVSNLAKKYYNILFFISAGPLANIFINRMYLENPNNTYIDTGSSIDVFTKGIHTRDYQYNFDIYTNSIPKDLPIIL